jgi:hypothetical protein
MLLVRQRSSSPAPTGYSFWVAAIPQIRLTADLDRELAFSGLRHLYSTVAFCVKVGPERSVPFAPCWSAVAIKTIQPGFICEIY